MAYNLITFDASLPYGRLLRNMLTANESADEQMAKVFRLIQDALEGDGTSDAHYDKVMSLFAFESNTKAHAFYEELASAFSKTSGNGSVSNVRAARDQLFAKLRG
jgi:hypothetical protein